jgi:sortase (surface protein transpeptidase)
LSRREAGTGAAASARVRRRWPVLAMAAGALMLAAAALVGWRSDGEVRQFGPTPSPTPPTLAATAPAEKATAPAEKPRVAAVPPRRLTIPAIDVDAAVRATGIDEATGELDVPRSVDTVGWYRFGPELAAGAGSVVIAGHVDSAEQGQGAFFRLRDLRAGDRVTVTGPGGETRVYTVDSRRVYAKSSAPMDRLFARDGPPRLTLITCGGTFDRRDGHYRDNVVVTAGPA